MSITISRTLDCKPYSSPLPVMMATVAIRRLHPGDMLEVLATDPVAVTDFKAWCRATGNELLDSTHESGIYQFVIRKG
jgi:tRNA 2-thiouridine synthesizing protein A